MATRYAVATGNWSAVGTWDGGTTLPTSSDDVYADGKTVTIDQDVTVLSLRTTARSGGTAGGGFTCSTARTINCSGGSGIIAGTTAVLTLSHTSGNTVALLGAITGGSVLGDAVTISGTGTTNITGNIVGGTGSNARAITVSANATLNVTGSATAGTGQGAYGIVTAVNCTIAVTGNVIGPSGTSNQYGAGVQCSTGYTGTLTVTGDVTGGSLSYTGANQGWGIYSTFLTTITGTLTAGSSAPAVYMLNTLTASGPFIAGSTGIFPIMTVANANNGCPIVKLTGITNNEFRFVKSTGGTTSLWSSDVNSGAPSAANVRKGTTFGVSNEFVGTAAIPAAQNVLYGVPVDATTGTASITADKWLSPL